MNQYLFMLLIGCKPPGRHTEQHDVFFGIAPSVKELIPQLISFWPEAEGKLHIDGYRKVTHVNGYEVKIVPASEPISSSAKLFFINLGGYKQNEFEEYHYKMIYAAVDKAESINASKQTAFYKHTGFEGANSHIDDKYGVDVDDVYEIEDILSPAQKEGYKIILSPAADTATEDELHLGYFKLSSFVYIFLKAIKSQRFKFPFTFACKQTGYYCSYTKNCKHEIPFYNSSQSFFTHHICTGRYSSDPC